MSTIPVRYKFYKWLLRDVFKIQVGFVLPRYLIWLRFILFPLDSIYTFNKGLNYCIERDGIFIDGVFYDRGFFRCMKVGTVFEVVELPHGCWPGDTPLTLKKIKPEKNNVS